MKRYWSAFLSIIDSLARARAATYFTRIGRPDLAKNIMLKD